MANTDVVAGAAAKATAPFTSLFNPPKPQPAAPGPMPTGGDADWNALATQSRQAAAWLGQNMPDPGDPAYANDPEQYDIDFLVWQEMFGVAIDTARNLSEYAMGYQVLPDGTIVGLDQMDPSMRAAAEAENTNRFRAMQNALGLQQANLQDDREQATFNNEVTLVDQAMDRDDLSLRQAESKIDRALSGRQESRQRAQLVSDVKQRAAPYTTRGGKTSFSGNDLGSAVGSLAQFVGVNPDSSLLNYGSTMLDPEGDMGRFDADMGVAGALAEIPELASLLLGSPSAPKFGTSPGLLPYVDPQMAGPKQSLQGVGNAVTGGARSLADAIGLGPSGETATPAFLLAAQQSFKDHVAGKPAAGSGRPTWVDPF